MTDLTDWGKHYYTMNENSDETVYMRGKKLNNTHWGQLKLFTTEFIFLVENYDPDEVNQLVYVGAAPGEHIFVLSQLFPSIIFNLFDTNDFDSRLSSIENVIINRRYFSNKDVKHWSKKKCIFISDIRTLSYDSSKTKLGDMKKNEDIVWEDMALQRRWVEQIKPLHSLLKFRLPYAEKFELSKGRNREYLAGTVYTQPFSKSASSETRLYVGNPILTKQWDIVSYERKLFHHNLVTRKKKFKHPIHNNEDCVLEEYGLYNDFDSVYLASVVIDYMHKINTPVDTDNMNALLKFILNNITVSRRLVDIRKNYNL